MLPAKKKSKNDKRKRRSHHARKPPNLVACPKCGKSKLSHIACGECGYVSDRVMLPTADKDA